ncbi:Mitochondrial fission factor [Heterocephalus glaber]|uniref:Mitochondrial fission factor n=1 Tax=Heterocephalus glaber TaxID=10181 RepID=G5B2C7_HETGA|nr:Mitochondrial fission factor [Heterocephalus glaber]
MRVPEKLKVAPPNADLEKGFQEGVPNGSVIMQVPGRIVAAENNEDISFSRPADLDFIQSTPLKPLALKTPPHVLTPSETPLDFLDLDLLQPLKMMKYGISNIDPTVEGATDDMNVVDAASLRRQIIKLNRSLQLLEEENKERAKREMVTYSITVAFWLLNSWLWFRC